MEYPQTPEFGCDMEDFDVDEYWKKQAEIYNKQTADEMKERLEELNKMNEEKIYEYLINKYSRLIVETAGFEEGKIYHMDISHNEKFILDVFNYNNIYIRKFDYDSINKMLTSPKIMNNEDKLYRLICLYEVLKGNREYIEHLKLATCKPASTFYLNIFLNNKRFESIELLENGSTKYHASLTLRYLSDLISDENKNIPFVLELKGFSDEDTFTYYVKENGNLYKENKKFTDCSFLTREEATKFFVMFYDLDLGDYSRYLTKNYKLHPRVLFLIKLLKSLGITFEIEENVNLDKLIIE